MGHASSAVMFALQLLFNPLAILALMLLLGFEFPCNPIGSEQVSANVYRPSSVGAVVLLVLAVGLSLLIFRKQCGRWWAPDIVSWRMSLTNLVAGFALWTWIVDGIEGNLFGFLFLPLLTLASVYWFHCLPRTEVRRPVRPNPPGPTPRATR